MEPGPLILQQFIGLSYQPWMIDGNDCGSVSGMNELQRKPKYSEEMRASAALSITDPTTVGSQWLTIWAKTQPNYKIKLLNLPAYKMRAMCIRKLFPIQLPIEILVLEYKEQKEFWSLSECKVLTYCNERGMFTK
jgi:hypothetical protein